MTSVDPAFWRGRRVFLTGHTGFKGSWLSLWLQHMGAELRGCALDAPTTPSLFHEARVAQGMDSLQADIRDATAVDEALCSFGPEIVIHMAAQPLVRLSYDEPVLTYQTNVMGTVHLLEAVRRCASVRAVVNVTTDKCYENREWVWGYRETEPMGGYDPYSSSKGCSELVTAAWRRSFMADQRIALASARAGNVIGGGDWASDRLIPDLLRAFESGQSAAVRNPTALRPWQHVLEPLSGYLMLAERLVRDGQRFAEGWNFGPDQSDAQPVSWIAEHMSRLWGDGAGWQTPPRSSAPHEAHVLRLDCAKAHAALGWTPRWPLAHAIERIVAWHRAWLAGQDMRQQCLSEIAAFASAPAR